MGKFLKIAVSLLMVIGLGGCSNGPSGKPTVANQKSDKEAYSNLMGMTVEVEKIGKDGKEETENFLVYVPKSKYGDVYGSSAYSSANGVTLDVSVNDYFYEEGDFADQVLEYYKEDIESNRSIFQLVNSSELSVDENRENASYEALFIEENFDGNGMGVYKFYAAKELKSGHRLVIELEVIEDECNKLTDPLIKEIEEYYDIKVGFNLEEATKAVDEFNANPPTTKIYDAYDFTFEIPFRYALDYSSSNYLEDDYVFGIDGDGNNYDDNLQVLVLSDDSYPYTSEELKIDVEKLFEDVDGGKVTVSDSDFSPEGKAIVRCKIKSGVETLDGYIVSYKSYVVYFATITNLTETSDESLNVVKTAIDTFKISR